MLSIRVIEEAEELWDFAPQWKDLARRGAETPFQTPQWNLAWWELVGRRDPTLTLHTLVFERDGAPCAVAPLMLREEGGGRALNFVSDPYADYLDMLIDPAVEPSLIHQEFFAHLRRGLKEHWDVVQLREVPKTSSTLAYLQEDGGGERSVTLRPSSVCPRLELNDEAATARALGIKEYAVKQRRLGQIAPLACHHFAAPADIEARLPAYMAMHLRQWSPKLGRGISFDDATIERFYREAIRFLAPHGLLLLTELTLGGRPLAYYYGFIHRQTFWGYRPTYDVSMAKYSPGAVMHRLMFIDLKERGFRTFDFMRGDYAYKYRYANVLTRNTDLLMWPGGFAA
jgi:CelD/BcsL family acetyltransferase involved in cellulose biosynthesis